jgi:hypothetical protein
MMVDVDALIDACNRAIKSRRARRADMTRLQRERDAQLAVMVAVDERLAVDARRARVVARELSGRRYFRASPYVPGRTAQARPGMRVTLWPDDERLVFTWDPAGVIALPLVPHARDADAVLAIAKGGAPCKS